MFWLKKILILSSFAFLFALSVHSFANETKAGITYLSYEEFKALAEELAPKVNLFNETWKLDKEAEFYGGTSRDYLYWLKGQFRAVKSRAEAEVLVKQLRELPAIDIRDFIIGDSDVDIVSKNYNLPKPERYGVRKIDKQDPDIFNAATELGYNERHQGHIPAEKIRLGKKGFIINPELGDGMEEIYSGRLTVHFADIEKFKLTKYAKANENHPILLTLRFLRLQAMNYYQSYGSGYPDKAKLLQGIDEHTKEELEKIIAQTLNGNELKPYLAQPRFKSWLNAAIQKSFRSYTNPTAALELMRVFKINRLVEVYPDLEPLNLYVFAKYRDETKINKALRDYHIDSNKFFEPIEKHFPDAFIYHGTKKETDFRNILFQGILPSSNGTAGTGLYGVAEHNKAFSETWGGDKNRLVKLPIKKNAKIVDITKGEGKRIWNEFNKSNIGNYEAFADTFGIDIIQYPYSPDAYVVKNSTTLGRAQGVNRQILSLSKAMLIAKSIKSTEELIKFLPSLELQQFTEEEMHLIINCINTNQEQLLKLVNEYNQELNVIKYFLTNPKYMYPSVVQAILNKNITKSGLDFAAKKMIYYELAKAIGHQGWDKHPEVVADLIAKDNVFLDEILIRDALSHSQWTDHPEFIETIFLRNKKQVMKTIVENILANKDWSKNIKTKEWITRIVNLKPFKVNNQVDIDVQELQQQIIYKILNKDLWSDHPEWVEKLMSYRIYNRALAQNILPLAFWSKYPQLLDTLIDAKADTDIVASHILSTEAWAKRPEAVGWIKKLIAEKNENIDRQLAVTVLSKEMWANHPEIVAELIKNGRMDFEVAQHILSKPYWAKHPQLLQMLLDKNYPNLDAKIVEFVLTQPAWAKHPEFLETILDRNNSNTIEFIIKYLLSQKHWANNAKLLKLIKDLIAKGSFEQAIIAGGLTNEHWSNHPELVEALLDKDSKILDKNIIYYILSKPYWGDHEKWLDRLMDKHDVDLEHEIMEYYLSTKHGRKHPKSVQWISDFIKNNKFIDNIALNILSKSYWTDHPELVEAIINKNNLEYNRRIINDTLNNTHTNNQSAWKPHPRLVEILIKKNNPKIDEEIERTLLRNPYWLSQPDLLKAVDGKPITIENLRKAFARGVTFTYSSATHTFPEGCAREFSNL